MPVQCNDGTTQKYISFKFSSNSDQTVSITFISEDEDQITKELKTPKEIGSLNFHYGAIVDLIVILISNMPLAFFQFLGSNPALDRLTETFSNLQKFSRK